jgi:ACS family D-galactonate transporter-like MFS transporter
VKIYSSYQVRLLALLAASQALAYCDRVNLSVVVPDLIKNDGYTPASAGLLLSLFNWSYMLAILFAGPLTDYLKPRRVYPFAVAIWSVATALCGVSTAFAPLALCRVGVGIAEAPMIPSGTRVIRENFPQRFWATTVSLFFSGNKIGLALGIPLSSFILWQFGRPWVFYICGALGLVWALLWIPTYQQSQAQETQQRAPLTLTRWLALFRHRASWGIMLGQVGYLYVYFVFATWLPGYLVLQYHMETMQSGLLAMLPFLLGFVMTILGGWTSDRLIAKGWSVTYARKSIAVGGLVFAVVFVMIGALMQNPLVAVTCFTLAVGGVSFATATVNTMPVDIAPPHLVATFTSLQAFGGNLGGALAPLITGLLVSATGSFVAPLIVTACVGLVFGAGGYGLLMPNFDRPLEDLADASPSHDPDVALAHDRS